MEYQEGMFVKSLAGHDSGKIYIILKQDEKCVYLADGKLRTADRLKKKKKIHVQLIGKVDETIAAKLSVGTIIQNEDIKRAIGGIIHV